MRGKSRKVGGWGGGFKRGYGRVGEEKDAENRGGWFAKWGDERRKEEDDGEGMEEKRVFSRNGMYP